MAAQVISLKSFRQTKEEAEVRRAIASLQEEPVVQSQVSLVIDAWQQEKYVVSNGVYFIPLENISSLPAAQAVAGIVESCLASNFSVKAHQIREGSICEEEFLLSCILGYPFYIEITLNII